jgi:hypothetical protein
MQESVFINHISGIHYAADKVSSSETVIVYPRQSLQTSNILRRKRALSRRAGSAAGKGSERWTEVLYRKPTVLLYSYQILTGYI